MSGGTAWSFAPVLASATSSFAGSLELPGEPTNDALAVRVEERLEHQPEAGPRRDGVVFG
ncbi:hypothetical protein HRbin26_02031 [bacterium HR26]|nr:hypothetical protein HRbin26_02031 [bacterium HR26]